MEIQTTIKDFSSRIKKLGVSPETSIRVFLDVQVISEDDKPKKIKMGGGGGVDQERVVVNM